MDRRRLIEVMVVVVAAAALSSLAMVAIVVPFERLPISRRVQFAVGYGLDAPVAVLNRALPESARSHMSVVFHCNHTYCFPDPLPVEAARYLRVGIPAYALLFYAPALLRALVPRRRRSEN